MRNKLFLLTLFTLAVLAGFSCSSSDDTMVEQEDANAQTDAEVAPDIDSGVQPDATTGVDAGLVCMDANGNNHTQFEAIRLTNGFIDGISDCDLFGDTVRGAASSIEVDWFRYHGADDSCLVDPSISVVIGDVEACIYLECDDSVTSFSCPDGSVDDIDDQGTPGCCGTSFSIDDLICSDAIVYDNAVVFMSVRARTPGVCENYEFTYHY